MKRFVSWNVNGLRACMGKGFADFFNEIDADIFAIQESKLQEGQIDFAPAGYHCYWKFKRNNAPLAVMLRGADAVRNRERLFF